MSTYKNKFSLAEKLGYKSPFDDLLNKNINIIDENKKDSPKTAINALISLEPRGKMQFDDTKNTIWKVFYIPNLAEYQKVVEILEKYTFKNFCLLHHGNTYSTIMIDKDKRPILNYEYIIAIEKVIQNKEKKELVNLTEEYFDDLLKESEVMYKDGLKLDSIKSYFSLKYLIANLHKEGSYFSIACNEADNPNIMQKISEFNSNNINIYANSNFSTIDLEYEYAGIINYGSILNYFLTPSKWWNDDSGWKMYNKSQDKVIETQKDLWLFSSHKSKIFELIFRKKELSVSQMQKQKWAQMYYSKGFEKQYVTKFGEAAFKEFIKTIEIKYPEFKP